MRRSCAQWVLALACAGLLSAAAHGDDWPQFRGPDGQGHSSARDVPSTWSEQENIAWKVAIDGLGWSSPVIAAGQIWLTTATDEGRSLRAVAIDAARGKTLKN